MTGSRDRLMKEVLPPALEVMTAFSQSDDDPGFYWRAVQRVLTDTSSTGQSGSDPVAQLTFGLTALAGILLDDLSASSGQEPTQILAELHRRYLAA
jgi:hypothetical protein